MVKGRLEAFSDGVIAIVITIMVFDMKAPEGSDIGALISIAPFALTYVLSFIYLGIYWNNHHHLLQLTERINGSILWANLHLLFWLSLIPFGTAWLHKSGFAPLPVAVYGVVLFLSSVAWAILQAVIISHQGPESPIRAAIGRDWKAVGSSLLYVVAIGISFFAPWVAVVLYSVVALIWLNPDRRFEKQSNRRLNQHQ